MPYADRWLSMHFHTMLFGWTIQLVNVDTLFGVPATVAFGMQMIAAVCFALHLWPRVKAFGAG